MCHMTTADYAIPGLSNHCLLGLLNTANLSSHILYVILFSHVYNVYIVLTLLTNDKLIKLLVLLLLPYIFS